MYHYTYATPKELKLAKAELEKFIHVVQDEVRDYFTFRYEYIGSSSKKRNLVTYDPKTNIGFDFDINLYVNDDECNYDPREIRGIILNAFQKLGPRYEYTKFENSTSVITVKNIDFWRGSIRHSCDFAIVYDAKKGQQYIRYNKEQDYFSWEYRSKGFKHIEERADWLKKRNHWQEVRDMYLYLKNINTDPDKHSRSLYAETINNLYKKYHK